MNSNMELNGRAVMRTYDRTWEEIEAMLNRAESVKNNWQCEFERARSARDRDAMKDAARNYKALEGVVKTLRWTLGERGVVDPLS